MVKRHVTSAVCLNKPLLLGIFPYWIVAPAWYCYVLRTTFILVAPSYRILLENFYELPWIKVLELSSREFELSPLVFSIQDPVSHDTKNDIKWIMGMWYRCTPWHFCFGWAGEKRGGSFVGPHLGLWDLYYSYADSHSFLYIASESILNMHGLIHMYAIAIYTKAFTSSSIKWPSLRNKDGGFYILRGWIFFVTPGSPKVLSPPQIS